MNDKAKKNMQSEWHKTIERADATPKVLGEAPSAPNPNARDDLLPLLQLAEGINDKWHIVDVYPTTLCEYCGEHRYTQYFVRSAEPYGRIETQHAGCNVCKFTSLNNGLTQEDFARMYCGFKGVWHAMNEEEFKTECSAKLWQPRKDNGSN